MQCKLAMSLTGPVCVCRLGKADVFKTGLSSFSFLTLSGSTFHIGASFSPDYYPLFRMLLLLIGYIVYFSTDNNSFSHTKVEAMFPFSFGDYEVIQRQM